MATSDDTISILPVIKIKTKSKYKINKNSKIFPMCEYILYFDGCSKGNPGPSGIGAVLYNNHNEIWSDSKYIGDNRTNNEAEYSALIFGLEEAIRLKISTISVCGDSLLVINQINGLYKIRNHKLIPLYEKIMLLKQQFTYIDFNHIYRENNKRADQLSNLALDFMISETATDTDITEIEEIECIEDIQEIEEDWNQEQIINTLFKRTFLPEIKN